MKLFSSESIFNAKTGKWEERYWINGSPVDGDLYFFEMDREKEIENEKLKLEEDNIDDDQCDCIECTLDRYVKEIQEINGGCPGCIREVLQGFLCEIVEHIVVEDIECGECGILN